MTLPPSPTILVVDDTPTNLKVVDATLSPRGYIVVTADSGTEALAKAAAVQPDLILLDIMMPGMNGYEVCQQLREAEATRLVPIVMLSAVPGRAAAIRALDVGADDFIAKPFDREELLARVRAHLRMRRLRDARVAPVEEPEDVTVLRAAIAAGQLILYYQPKLEARTNRLMGVETLVRWQHPTRGLVPPGWFIPLAERSGLIRAVSESVLGIALRQCRAWADDGHMVPVAVNLSALDVQHLGLPALIFELLMSCEVAPTQLTVELTESAMMADPLRAIEVLTRLHDEGIQISLDDFGTGYSSLSYLRQLPVDELKIDHSFTAALITDPGSQTIVRSTIALAHDLGLRVVRSEEH